MFKLSPVFSLMPLYKLRPSELDILLKKTDFSKDDIQEWYQIFLKQCPDGKLDKVTVLDLLEGKKKMKPAGVLRWQARAHAQSRQRDSSDLI